jgi:histidine triad (HIT) family protein
MSTLFTQIYQGKLPGFVIAENDDAFAILNRFPNQPGHTLVIPKLEVGHLFELPPAAYQSVMSLAYQLAPQLQHITQAEKIGVVVEGYGVKDHAHVHLIPLKGAGDLDISAAPEASDDELARLAKEFESNI